MSKIYFTADLHFGHKRILEMYPDRPFADDGDIDKHDAYIIEQWNQIVGKNNDVYILGDLSIRSVDETRKILERLNGHKYLCPGNHDKSVQSLVCYFVKVQQIIEVKIKQTRCPELDEDVELILCHYPLLEWPGMHHGVYHLHGHCHGNIEIKDPRRMDVGVDATNKLLTPIHEVVSILKTQCKA